MKTNFRIALFLFLVIFLAPIESLAQQRSPKIGYVYPAGGERGTTFQVLIGGRQIAKSQEIVISGQGVQGRILRGIPSMRLNDTEERQAINRLYRDAREKLENDSNPSADSEQETSPVLDEVVKKYPYLDRLANPTERDIELIYDFYFSPRPERKPVEALGQGVMAEITISPDAEPGDRDLRLFGQNALTPPVRFMVGAVPEIMEREPNDPFMHRGKQLEIWNRRVNDAPKSLSEQYVYDIPVVFNGQIRAGDIDRFQFSAKRGQKIVIDVHARHLTPYLADGVPGWFQAAVSLYDSEGRKIEEAMSYRHEADPVLLVEIPKNGVYTLEIQDSIFRGRDDFVYRITVGEEPFVTSVFPLGVSSGQTTGADVDGWNLPEKAVLFDAAPLDAGIYEISSIGKKPLLRPIRFAVDDLPQHSENEPNNTIADAEQTELPIIVNGRISDENDVDHFRFEGRKGQRIVLDVTARSLDWPLDAVLELLDSSGQRIARNDDRADSKGPNIGLETHHADPYLSVELPGDGQYIVRIYDATQRGGREYGYRLRISPPRPDFSVFCEPSGLSFRGGRSQSLKFRLVRKDGFEEEVELRPANDTPLRIEKGTISTGSTEATVELSLPRNSRGGFIEAQIEAVAKIGGKEIIRPVIAIEDMEQAFIYHHWVPAKSLIIFKSELGPNQNRRRMNAQK